MEARKHDITQALLDADGRDGAAAADRLWALVYEELRWIAHHQMREQRRGHTLSTTALVHEAYLKLVDQTRVTLRNRAQFFALCAKAMRNILVDYARRRNAQKRRGRKHRVPLEEAMHLASSHGEALLALDEALTWLEQVNERLAQVVELRFFAGLSIEETAEALEVSTRTVERDWGRAKAYLYERLQAGEDL